MTANADRAGTLERALRAAVAGDALVLREVMTDDVRAWTPAISTRSLAELLTELDNRDDAFSELDLDTSPLDVGGDFACVEWTLQMTHTGPLTTAGGSVVEASGVRVAVHGVTVAEFDGRRICSLRQYWDELATLEQIGMMRRDA